MRIFVEKGPHDAIDEKLIASVLREDYRLPPWNEQMICPVCKGLDDFGPVGIYSASQRQECPRCSNPLVSFWSDERMGRYLELASQVPGFLFLEVREDSDLTGWLWGYDLQTSLGVACDMPIFYIDVFAAVPAFRGKGQSVGDVRHGFRCFRRGEFSKLPSLAVEADIPVYGSLFLYLAYRQWKAGYKGLATRTHVDATHVKALLRGAGFQCVPGAPSDDPQRQYWFSRFVS